MGLMLLLPATGLAIAAYVVLYISGRSEGGMKTFGKILGAWTLLIAAVLAIGGVSAPFFGGRPFGINDGMGMRPSLGGPGSGPGGGMRGRMRPPAVAPAPAAPEAAPAPASSAPSDPH